MRQSVLVSSSNRDYGSTISTYSANDYRMENCSFSQNNLLKFFSRQYNTLASFMLLGVLKFEIKALALVMRINEYLLVDKFFPLRITIQWERAYSRSSC